jgi:hypothetical protein
MSIRRKILAVLDSMHRRMVGVEDDVERNARVAERNEQTLAKMNGGLERIERALVEQGKTLQTVLLRQSQESSRVGVQFKQHEEAIFNHEGRLGRLERVQPNGAE